MSILRQLALSLHQQLPDFSYRDMLANIAIQLLFFTNITIIISAISSIVINGYDTFTKIEKIVFVISLILAFILMIVHKIYFGGLI